MVTDSWPLVDDETDGPVTKPKPSKAQPDAVVCSQCKRVWKCGATASPKYLDTPHTACTNPVKGVWRAPRRDDDLGNTGQEKKVVAGRVFDPHAANLQVGDYYMWDRGKWRGWAVGQVEQIDPLTAVASVALSYEATSKTFPIEVWLDMVAKGQFFVVEPQGVITLLARQMEVAGHFEAATLAHNLVDELNRVKTTHQSNE